MIASGITTAGAFGIGLICITTYAATTPRPAIAPGVTAICAVAATVGALLILTAVILRIVMPKLTEIKKAVDAHAHHVEREHGGLHEDAVDIGKQLAELRALVAELRHQVQPEQQPERPEQPKRHVPPQRRRRPRKEVEGQAGATDNVVNLNAKKVYQLGIAEGIRRRKRGEEPPKTDS